MSAEREQRKRLMEKHDPGYIHVCYREDMWDWGEPRDEPKVRIPDHARATLKRAVDRAQIEAGIRPPVSRWRRIARRLRGASWLR